MKKKIIAWIANLCISILRKLNYVPSHLDFSRNKEEKFDRQQYSKLDLLREMLDGRGAAPAATWFPGQIHKNPFVPQPHEKTQRRIKEINDYINNPEFKYEMFKDDCEEAKERYREIKKYEDEHFEEDSRKELEAEVKMINTWETPEFKQNRINEKIISALSEKKFELKPVDGVISIVIDDLILTVK